MHVVSKYAELSIHIKIKQTKKNFFKNWMRDLIMFYLEFSGSTSLHRALFTPPIPWHFSIPAFISILLPLFPVLTTSKLWTQPPPRGDAHCPFSHMHRLATDLRLHMERLASREWEQRYTDKECLSILSPWLWWPPSARASISTSVLSNPSLLPDSCIQLFTLRLLFGYCNELPKLNFIIL